MEILAISGGFMRRKTNPIYLAPSTAGGRKTYLKKQSQFIRTGCCVLCTSKGNLKKQSQSLAYVC
jgi:hypothetical protein